MHVEESGRSEAVVEFFVSPKGNDRWSGRRPDPDLSGRDGPFATLEAAQAAIRKLKGSRPLRQPIRVRVRGGTYFLERPLRFTAQDSGCVVMQKGSAARTIEQDNTVVWTAYRDERPILSGGVRIGNWRETQVRGRRAWVADLPGTRGTDPEGWRFRQLFVNGRRAPRTRLPKTGFYHVEEVLDGKPTHYRVPTRRIRYAPGHLRKWKNLSDVEIVAFTRWIENRLPLKSVDSRRRTATFDRASVHALVQEGGGGRGAPYCVENVFEALDTPGQWYLDRSKGKLYYLPLRDESPATTEVIAPRLAEVLRIEGTSRRPVTNLRFEGLTFAHTEWPLPEGWAGSNQAAHEVPGAVVLRHAQACAFVNCDIEHVGTYGLEVLDGCLDVEVRHGRIRDLGAGGVKVGHDSARTTISDCEIAHGGRLFPSAVGVWIGHSPGNKVLHNHIHDFYYTGISVGWVWGYAPSKAVGNLIEWNHVHDLGQGMLSDLGGIYTLGVSPGTRIRFNLFHDIRCRVYGGWGIYTDEGSTDILIEKNIAYRCNRSGFHQHYGRDNLVQNNIFAFGDQEQVARSRVEDHLSFTFRRNIVYYTKGQLVGRKSPEINCRFERNLYWNAAGRPLEFEGRGWQMWTALGQDAGSIVADPLFVDPEHGDFRFRSGSPYTAIGFEPFDLSDVGPRPRPSPQEAEGV